MTAPTYLIAAYLVWKLVTLPWSLWAAYVAIMRLKQVREAGQLTTAHKVFGYPLLVYGLWLDFWCNVLIASALFKELPREWTVSSRLTRLSATDGWRGELAFKMRSALLDNIDPAGIHMG